MTETRPATEAELGVVDPIRIPGSARVRRAWTGLPLVGRAFVVLAAADLVLRLSGRSGLPSYLSLDAPIGLVTGFLPHYAALLFPVVLLLRQPGVRREAPLLLRGAVVVAAVELAASTLRPWLTPAGGDITTWAVLQVGISIAGGAGYVLLALGLRSVDRSTPTPSLAGLANLVAGLIAAAAIVSIVVQATRPARDLGEPGWNALVLLTSVAGQLQLIAFAYLAQTVLRGTSDLRRPRDARVLAATAMLLSGVDAFLTVAVGVLVLAQDLLHVAIPVVAGGFVLALLGSGFVLLLLVAAFGLGLGDASGRIGLGRQAAGEVPAGTHAAAVAWPTPGGEVPAYHPSPEESKA